MVQFAGRAGIRSLLVPPSPLSGSVGDTGKSYSGVSAAIAGVDDAVIMPRTMTNDFRNPFTFISKKFTSANLQHRKEVSPIFPFGNRSEIVRSVRFAGFQNIISYVRRSKKQKKVNPVASPLGFGRRPGSTCLMRPILIKGLKLDSRDPDSDFFLRKFSHTFWLGSRRWWRLP